MRGIERLRRHSARVPLGVALPVAQLIVKALEALPAVQRVALAGSCRRGRETIGDLDIIASSDDPAAVMDAFVALPGVEQVLAQGREKASVVLAQGLQVDLLVVRDDQFAAALHHFTGSKEHNIALRELAKAGAADQRARHRGRITGASGRGDGSRRVRRGGPAFHPAGIAGGRIGDRRGPRSALAAAGRDFGHPRRLARPLHVERRAPSILEMAEAAQARGYEYIAITDHSKSLGVAGGLSPEQLLAQMEEIRELNRRWDDFRILAGARWTFCPTARWIIADELLARLDIVVASVHSAMHQDEETMTERLVAAMRHPYVDIIGHPTGGCSGGGTRTRWISNG